MRFPKLPLLLAYGASPTCAPPRAALLTGRYGLRNGTTYNHQPTNPKVRK